jgi:AcrR family transcriptional regulator
MVQDGSELSGAPRLQRRLPGRDRAEHILTEATRFFAELGLEGRTRDLAQRLGVTQALLYRYYPTKAALIDRVYERAFGDCWVPAWDVVLDDRNKPLADRLVAFYDAYLDGLTATRVRLFVHAGLHGGDLTRHYAQILTDRMVRPIVAGLRAESGLPPLEALAMSRPERDLAEGLHGSVLFLTIRKFVFTQPATEDLRDQAAQLVRVFVAGAKAELGRQMRAGLRDAEPIRACR